MLNIKFIRENKDLVKEVVVNKKATVDIDELLKIDQQRRDLILEVDNLRQQRNEASKNRDIEKGRELKEKLEGLENDFSEVDEKYSELMSLVPNVYSEDTPIGKDESENKVIRRWGEIRDFDFEVKDHIEIGEKLGIIDMDSAGKVTGARFYYLKGELVLLQMALINYTLGILQDEEVLKTISKKIDEGYSYKRFTPVLPPVMIRPEVYKRMGRLDATNIQEKYHIPTDDLYLIGSAEHTLGPMHMDQILEEKDLPKRYVGYSTSFRREAGSYGKDTRGILRVHQFDKIEIESFTTAENSLKEQEFIVAIQEYLLQSLGLPYQVVMICTGDMGTPDYRQVDMETWIPSQKKYRETHTSDLMTDYQSRRLNIKVKRGDGKSELVHMNDATAFAMSRILIAILENYQQADGSVKIPEVLIPYTGFSEIRAGK